MTLTLMFPLKFMKIGRVEEFAIANEEELF
jgi:hypothetical protein